MLSSFFMASVPTWQVLRVGRDDTRKSPRLLANAIFCADSYSHRNPRSHASVVTARDKPQKLLHGRCPGMTKARQQGRRQLGCTSTGDAKKLFASSQNDPRANDRLPPRKPALHRPRRHPLDGPIGLSKTRTSDAPHNARDDHHRAGVHLAAEKPHRRRRRAMPAPIASAAKTHPTRVVASRLAEFAPRFSRIVGPVQRTAAIPAPSLADLLGLRQIDPRELLPKTLRQMSRCST